MGAVIIGIVRIDSPSLLRCYPKSVLFLIGAVSPPALAVSLRSVATSESLGGLFKTDFLAPHYPKGSINGSGWCIANYFSKKLPVGVDVIDPVVFTENPHSKHAFSFLLVPVLVRVSEGTVSDLYLPVSITK